MRMKNTILAISVVGSAVLAFVVLPLVLSNASADPKTWTYAFYLGVFGILVVASSQLLAYFYLNVYEKAFLFVIIGTAECLFFSVIRQVLAHLSYNTQALMVQERWKLFSLTESFLLR
jgi:hypothetical protein